MALDNKPYGVYSGFQISPYEQKMRKKSKTTFKVRTKRWGLFNRECKVMSIRRDDLINRVLGGEIQILKTITPCDAIGAKWLKDRWITEWQSDDVDMLNAPVMLTEDVLTSLNQTCAEMRVPRDAFFDCFVAFLTARMVDAALVIKDPRTDRDLASGIVQLRDDANANDASAEELGRWLVEETDDWAKQRDISVWDKKLYERRLAWNSERVEQAAVIHEL